MKRSASSYSEGCSHNNAADYLIDEDEEEMTLLAASILADLASTSEHDAAGRDKTVEPSDEMLSSKEGSFEDNFSSDSDDDDDDAPEAGLSGLFRTKMTTKDEVSACSPLFAGACWCSPFSKPVLDWSILIIPKKTTIPR